MHVYSMQARDNVKFLTTLERHFRSISSGPLTGILDTLPLLMNALRMIWIISRYYSDDAHMGGLFARIGVELCERVNGAIMLHTLFRMPADEAIELLRVSKAVLECWQSTYMQVTVPGPLNPSWPVGRAARCHISCFESGNPAHWWLC
jgi:dynein heavy chain